MHPQLALRATVGANPVDENCPGYPISVKQSHLAFGVALKERAKTDVRKVLLKGGLTAVACCLLKDSVGVH